MSRPADEPNEVLCGDLGWLLDRAGHAYATRLRAALAEAGGAPRTQCVLATALQGPHTQIELAQEIGLDKTTLVATIDALELDGLAVRRPDPHDRRARVIEVTDKGREAYEQGREIARRVQEEILAELPARQREALLPALRALITQDREPVAVGSS